MEIFSGIKKSEMELLFDEYLKRDDLLLVKDNKEFHRIIRKDKISWLG